MENNALTCLILGCVIYVTQIVAGSVSCNSTAILDDNAYQIFDGQILPKNINTTTKVVDCWLTCVMECEMAIDCSSCNYYKNGSQMNNCELFNIEFINGKLHGLSEDQNGMNFVSRKNRRKLSPNPIQYFGRIESSVNGGSAAYWTDVLSVIDYVIPKHTLVTGWQFYIHESKPNNILILQRTTETSNEFKIIYKQPFHIPIGNHSIESDQLFRVPERSYIGFSYKSASSAIRFYDASGSIEWQLRYHGDSSIGDIRNIVTDNLTLRQRKFMVAAISATCSN